MNIKTSSLLFKFGWEHKIIHIICGSLILRGIRIASYSSKNRFKCKYMKKKCFSWRNVREKWGPFSQRKQGSSKLKIAHCPQRITLISALLLPLSFLFLSLGLPFKGKNTQWFHFKIKRIKRVHVFTINVENQVFHTNKKVMKKL